MTTQEFVALHQGAASAHACAVALAANRRLQARNLNAFCCTIPPAVRDDPNAALQLTAGVMHAIAKAAWALGARRETLDEMQRTGVVPVGVQRLVCNPGLRDRTEAGRAQLARGARRMRVMAAERKRRAAERAKEQKQHGDSPRTRAVNAFLALVGTTEHPAGSNGGGIITAMQVYWGFGHVPWCGIAAGYHAKKVGGVQLSCDVASVQAITNHAKAKQAPYGHFQEDPRGALPGAFVIIGGPGTHVGMLVEALSDGSARTVEGNTSFGPSGSQSNGGCVAARVRSPAEIYGIATMNYPH